MRRTLSAIGIVLAAGCPVSAPSDAVPAAGATAAPPATEPATTAAPHAERAAAPNAPPLEETGALETRPIVAAFRGALAALHAGDADPIHGVVDPSAVWTVPVARREAQNRDALVAALRDGIAGPTRILDLGAGGFATQLRTSSGDGVLAIAEVTGTQITAMRTYGADPYGAPPGSRSSASTPAIVAAAIASGRPNLNNVAITKRLYQAAASSAWTKIESSIAPGATHESHANASDRPGTETTLVRSFAALLADPTARLTIRRQHAVGDWVLVEAVVSRGEGVTQTPSVGFVDVLRVHDGRIAASWRYLNHPVSR